MQIKSFPAQGFDLRVSESRDMIGVIFSYRTPEMSEEEENLSTPRIIMSVADARTFLDALQNTIEASETGEMRDWSPPGEA